MQRPGHNLSLDCIARPAPIQAAASAPWQIYIDPNLPGGSQTPGGYFQYTTPTHMGRGSPAYDAVPPPAPVKGGGYTPGTLALLRSNSGLTTPGSIAIPTPRLSWQALDGTPTPTPLGAGQLRRAVFTPTPQAQVTPSSVGGNRFCMDIPQPPKLQRAGTTPLTETASQPGLVRGNTQELRAPPARPGLRRAATTPLATAAPLESIPEDQQGLVRAGGVLVPGQIITVDRDQWKVIQKAPLIEQLPTTPQSRGVYTFATSTSPFFQGRTQITPSPMNNRALTISGQKPEDPQRRVLSPANMQGTSSIKLSFDADNTTDVGAENQQPTSIA